MDLQAFGSLKDIAKVEAMESASTSNPHRCAGQSPGSSAAFLYAARSSGLRAWSEELGLSVVHIGISSDPLLRVARLRGAGHAARTCFAHPYERDLPDGDWCIEPIDLGDEVSLPEGCRRWAGLVRVSLPPRAVADDLDRRLAMLLRPLDAVHCAQMPKSVELRASTGRFIPALPRYTVQGDHATLAQDLYRLDGPGDVAFVIGALEGALRMLGPGRSIFDRIFESYSRVPDGQRRGSGAGAGYGAIRRG